MFLGPRSLPLAGLPHLPASRSVASHRRQVYRQFGLDPDKASDKQTVKNFRRKVLRELQKIKLAWKDLKLLNGSGRLDPASLYTWDRAAAVQGAKRRSEPLTARTDLERFAVRERRSEPTELLSQYTWAQLLILEIVR